MKPKIIILPSPLPNTVQRMAELVMSHLKGSQWDWKDETGINFDILIHTKKGAKIIRSGDLIIIDKYGEFYKDLFWLEDYKP